MATGIVFIAARFASDAVVDFSQVARRVIAEAGYEQPDFDPRTCTVVTSLKELPQEARLQLDGHATSAEDLDAIPVRNAVNAFGFATNQTPSLMPLPIELAHQFARRLASVAREKALPHLSMDASVQVGVEFRDRQPYRVHSITIVAGQNSTASPVALDAGRFNSDLHEAVIRPVLEQRGLRTDANTLICVNPESAFLVGRPSLHSGLTGRKNAIDTYGEYCRHSGWRSVEKIPRESIEWGLMRRATRQKT